MDNKKIKNKLNKIFEDMGGGMVSSAAGIVGIEGGMKKKKNDVIKKDITSAVLKRAGRA
jgi:hypothetical protein